MAMMAPYPMLLSSSVPRGSSVMNLYLSTTCTVGLPRLSPQSSSTVALLFSTLTTEARSPMFDSNSRNLFQISRLSLELRVPWARTLSNRTLVLLSSLR